MDCSSSATSTQGPFSLASVPFCRAVHPGSGRTSQPAAALLHVCSCGLAFHPCCSLDLVCPPSPVLVSISFQNMPLSEAFLVFFYLHLIFKILSLKHYYDHSHIAFISTIYMYVFPSRMQVPGGKGGILLIFVKFFPPN